MVGGRIEGKILVFQRAAVEAHHLARLPEQAGKLVHEAALHAGEFVLGLLGNAGQLQAAQVGAQQLVEGESQPALHGGRGRQAGAHRHVAPEHAVEARHGHPARLKLGHHAQQVVGPERGAGLGAGRARASS